GRARGHRRGRCRANRDPRHVDSRRMPVVSDEAFAGRLWAGGDASLAAFLDFDDLLRRAVAYASESAGTESARILLHDAEAREFVVAVSAGPNGNELRGSPVGEPHRIPRAGVLVCP